MPSLKCFTSCKERVYNNLKTTNFLNSCEVISVLVQFIQFPALSCDQMLTDGEKNI